MEANECQENQNNDRKEKPLGKEVNANGQRLTQFKDYKYMETAISSLK